MTYPATGLPNKLLTSRSLAALLGMVFVGLVVWAILKSTVTSDIGMMNDSIPMPNRNVFQRLHWLWLFLLVAPAIYIGLARLRTPVLCGIFAYGFGTVLGTCAAQLNFVLSDPLLWPLLWTMLAQSFCFGAVLGAVIVAGVQLVRHLIHRSRRHG